MQQAWASSVSMPSKTTTINQSLVMPSGGEGGQYSHDLRPQRTTVCALRMRRLSCKGLLTAMTHRQESLRDYACMITSHNTEETEKRIKMAAAHWDTALLCIQTHHAWMSMKSGTLMLPAADLLLNWVGCRTSSSTAELHANRENRGKSMLNDRIF